MQEACGSSVATQSRLSDGIVCALLVVCSSLLYGIIAYQMGILLTPSKANYFMRLADAFNHGSISLLSADGQTHDLIRYKERLYLYWAPLPAVLMMPLVYFFGTGLPDALMLAILGGINVGISFLIIRSPWRGVVLSRSTAIIIAITFGFGSVHMPLASSHGVWAVSQIVSYLFLSLSLLVVLRKDTPFAYLMAGLLGGLACLCRLSMMGAVIGIGCLVALGVGGRSPRHRAKKVIAFAIPLAGCALLYLAYNMARFGSPFETGCRYHLFAPRFAADVAQYGMASAHYIWTNFWYHYLAYPFWPGVSDPTEGGSLFLMTPIYCAAFATLLPRRIDLCAAALWLGIVLAALPALTLFGTGWIQIGPRYTLDYTPLLLVLVSAGIATWRRPYIYAGALISVIHYMVGRTLLPPM